MRAYRSIQEHTLKQQVETLFSLPASSFLQGQVTILRNWLLLSVSVIEISVCVS
jgi:hypothetical protein